MDCLKSSFSFINDAIFNGAKTIFCYLCVCVCVCGAHELRVPCVERQNCHSQELYAINATKPVPFSRSDPMSGIFALHDPNVQ